MLFLYFALPAGLFLGTVSAAKSYDNQIQNDGFQKHAAAQHFFFAKGHPNLPYHPVDRDEPFQTEQDGLAVYIDHLSSQRIADAVVPVIQIFDEHMPAISAVFSDSETVSGSVWVAFARLDPGTEKPQIVMTRNQGGGAICCFETTIFSRLASGLRRPINLPTCITE